MCYSPLSLRPPCDTTTNTTTLQLALHTPIMDDGSYSAATVAFVNWLRAGGTTVSDKIDLVDMRDQGAGRGVGMENALHTLKEQTY